MLSSHKQTIYQDPTKMTDFNINDLDKDQVLKFIQEQEQHESRLLFANMALQQENARLKKQLQEMREICGFD